MTVGWVYLGFLALCDWLWDIFQNMVSRSISQISLLYWWWPHTKAHITETIFASANLFPLLFWHSRESEIQLLYWWIWILIASTVYVACEAKWVWNYIKSNAAFIYDTQLHIYMYNAWLRHQNTHACKYMYVCMCSNTCSCTADVSSRFSPPLPSLHVLHVVCYHHTCSLFLYFTGSLISPKVVKSVHYCPATKKTIERKYSDLTSLEPFPVSAIYPTRVRHHSYMQFYISWLGNVYRIELEGVKCGEFGEKMIVCQISVHQNIFLL